MVHFKKILCMNDRKEEMHPALERAVDMARREGASLTVAEARDDIPLSPEYALSAADMDELRSIIVRDSEERLQKRIDPIKASGVEVTAKVMVGTQFLEIIKEVIRGGHDLLILSPQRKVVLRVGRDSFREKAVCEDHGRGGPDSF
jgi:universal stress protein E